MNTNRQRVAIAKAVGWRIEKSGDSAFVYPPGEKGGHGYHGVDVDHPMIIKLLPDYTNDLNAIQRAIESCVEHEVTAILMEICEIAKRDGSWPILASAAQRSEALLRTFDMWEDSSPNLDSENDQGHGRRAHGSKTENG